MNTFSCETKIIMGNDAVNYLAEQRFQRLFIVSDPFFAQNGWAERLGNMAADYQIFDRVIPDPSVALVAEGVGCMQKYQPDGMVAIGGGSALDCGKAILYFSEQTIPFLAIPTTSGSGSEVTDFAILTHEGVKHPLVDSKLKPCVAILEEKLLAQMPASLIADSGFDVISHALEAWVGKNANPITDALALDAFRTTLSLLSASFAGDKQVRTAVHTASTMAGLAFNHAGLGLCHALAHSLGGQFHIPHGRLNAILLPSVISCNSSVAGHRYAELAQFVGLSSCSSAMAIRALKNALIRLRNQLKLPNTLAQAGIDLQELQNKEDAIICAAMKDPCCHTNPMPVTREAVLQVLREVSGRG